MKYNRNMKKGRLSKKGFTIIEVVLFLAIASGLFAMVMTNMSSRVASRRYQGAIYDLAEDLRNTFSATINVENYRVADEYSSIYCSISSAFDTTGKLVANSEVDDGTEKIHDNYPGRTRCAVYGQIITFGENGGNEINHYDIIGLVKTGDVEPTGDDDVLNSLGRGEGGVSANIVTLKDTQIKNMCTVAPAGNFSSYRTQWDVTIENKKDRSPFRGAIMIARSPISGTIHTFIYRAYNSRGELIEEGDDSFDIQDFLKNNDSKKNCTEFSGFADSFLAKGINEDSSTDIKGKWIRINEDGSEAHLDVCLGSEDLYSVGNKRRAIRIHGDGSTEAAVEVMSEIDSIEICKEGNPS